MPVSVVFLDRAALSPRAHVKPLAIPHTLKTFKHTAPGKAAACIRDADIIVTSKVRPTARVLAEAPTLNMAAVAATGTDNVEPIDNIVALREGQARNVVTS